MYSLSVSNIFQHVANIVNIIRYSVIQHNLSNATLVDLLLMLLFIIDSKRFILTSLLVSLVIKR